MYKFISAAIEDFIFLFELILTDYWILMILF